MASEKSNPFISPLWRTYLRDFPSFFLKMQMKKYFCVISFSARKSGFFFITIPFAMKVFRLLMRKISLFFQWVPFSIPQRLLHHRLILFLLLFIFLQDLIRIKEAFISVFLLGLLFFCQAGCTVVPVTVFLDYIARDMFHPKLPFLKRAPFKAPFTLWNIIYHFCAIVKHLGKCEKDLNVSILI